MFHHCRFARTAGRTKDNNHRDVLFDNLQFTISAAKLQKKIHIRKSMSKKVDFCLEVREGSDLLRVHYGFIGYLDFPVITPLPLAEDKPKISPPFREHYKRSMGDLWDNYGFSVTFVRHPLF